MNPPGDSTATDGAATLELAARVHAEAMARVDDEAAQAPRRGDGGRPLRRPPRPARGRAPGGDARVPAGQLHLGRHLRPARQAARRRRPAPGRRAPPGLSPGHRAVPDRARPADGRRGPRDRGRHGRDPGPRPSATSFASSSGSGPSDKLVYFYVGRYGQDDLGWDRLERLGAPGHPLRRVPPRAGTARCRTCTSSRATEWTGADLAASADAIVAKAGYGTVCEAMVAGTPMIYPPRTGLRRAPRPRPRPARLGRGRPRLGPRLRRAAARAPLDRAFALKPGPPAVPRRRRGPRGRAADAILPAIGPGPMPPFGREISAIDQRDLSMDRSP